MADLVNNKDDEVEEEFHEVADSEKTPVTIVTGFLGSGKTTLVNYILKEQNSWKICVVENEFGEVSIDNDLVKENLAAKEDIIMLDNGCVCCSVRGDLVRTFAMLASRRKQFDAIIIETTGLADPSPIIFTFNSNALIQDNYRIDSVVCLVDAKHINIHLDEVRPDGNINEAEHQIAFADRILLNKLDLVNDDELEDVEDRIKSINSFATLIKTERSRAPLDRILNLNTFSLERVVEVDPTIMDEEEEHDHGHVHDEHCSHDHDCDHGHVHDEHCSHGHGDHKEHSHDHDHHEEHCKHPHHDAGHVHDEHCDHKEHSHDHHHHEEHCKHPHHDAGHVHDEHCDHKEHSHDHHHHEEHCKHPHHDAGHVHDEHCDHKEHHHEHGHNHDSTPKKKRVKKVHNLSLVSSVGYTIVGLLDVALFNAFMSSLLQAKAADLYRTKGVLAFAGQGDTKFVFQGVHEQINFGPSEKPFEADEVRESKMVFIGKNLDYDYLKESLLACCDDPTTAKITVHKRG